MPKNAKHYLHSSFREKLIEHLLIGELLKLNWQHEKIDLEIAKPEVDNGGYDLIAESNGTLRHIQLKASQLGATTRKQKIHLALGGKPSGCVVWVHFDEASLELGPFLFFGGAPGAPLPCLAGLKAARHTKGDSAGHKAERPNIKELPKSQFEVISSVEDLYLRLFGE